MTNLTAKDLRFGNYVNFIGQPYGGLKKGAIEVDSVHEYGINISCSQSYGNCELDRIEYRDIEPIPLTTSILEAAGFIHCGDESENQDYFSLPLKAPFGHWNLLLWVFDGKYVLDCYSTAVIIYVHQLQNLYHSLTGEELTLNLNQLQQA